MNSNKLDHNISLMRPIVIDLSTYIKNIPITHKILKRTCNTVNMLCIYKISRIPVHEICAPVGSLGLAGDHG